MSSACHPGRVGDLDWAPERATDLGRGAVEVWASSSTACRTCSARTCHVPDEVVVVPDIPRTLSGKRLEVPVKQILTGTPVDEAASTGALANPENEPIPLLDGVARQVSTQGARAVENDRIWHIQR